MTKESIATATAGAREFIRRAEELTADSAGSQWLNTGAKSGALRRQSLELTRALAAMRRP